MRLRLGRPIHVTYCTNVHPAESWAETFDGLRTFTLPIRDRVAPGRPFGVGLRLSDRAARELDAPRALADFRQFLSRHDLYVFTLNGFPFGDFHGPRVKENVFRPDWTAPERLDYTLRLARILARLLPQGVPGSVSTSPVSLKEWMDAPSKIDAALSNLSDAAAEFNRLSEESDRDLALGIEPEPLGLIENVQESVDFFQSLLWPALEPKISAAPGQDREAARRRLRGRIGLCYDACHMAVEFERADVAIASLQSAGIPIVKVQVSSALSFDPGPAALRALEPFGRDAYLHQVVARRRDGALRRWKDVAHALADPRPLLDSEEFRVHCHVPLFMAPSGPLRSTSSHVEDLLRVFQSRSAPPHFELETYTWSVLPDGLRSADLVDSIALEFDWFLQRLNAIEPQPS